MGSVFGKNIKISLFGESHGENVGVVIDNFPTGFKVDFENIRKELLRRAGGHDKLSTARREKDEFRFVSGIFNGYTTGAPLCALIPNLDVHSSDYSDLKNKMRPSHADFTSFIKYSGFNDYRGGGHFSARVTVALVVAGALAKQVLSTQDVAICSHIYSIGSVLDDSLDYVNISTEIAQKLLGSKFPTVSDDAASRMKDEILSAKSDNDSVGGCVETAISGLPAGIGSPFFDTVEGVLAKLIFAIPAVKAVEFGKGTSISAMRGSEANDSLQIDQKIVATRTNNCGGVCGGITNGMPLIVRASFKPTPSIGKTQDSIDIKTRQNCTLQITGRHDPCIVPRAVPIVESVVALGILDMLGGF